MLNRYCWLSLILCFSASAAAQESAVEAFEFPLQEFWRYEAAGREITGQQKAMLLAPQVDDLRVYFACANGTCGAILKRTAEPSWLFNIGRPFTAGLFLAEGGPLVAATQAAVYALEPETGILKWHRPSVSLISMSGLGTDSVVLCEESGDLICLRASDGSERWRAALGSPAGSTMLAAEGRIYLGTDDGGAWCLNADDGATIWRSQSGGPVRSGFCAWENLLFFGSGDRHAYCLDRSTGGLRWKIITPGIVNGIPVCDGRSLFIAASDRTLRVFKSSSGSARRRSPVILASNLGARPYLHGARLIYPDGSALKAISTEQLAVEGTFAAPAEVTTSLTRDPQDLVLYFGTREGHLIAVAARNHKLPLSRLPDERAGAGN